MPKDWTSSQWEQANLNPETADLDTEELIGEVVTMTAKRQKADWNFARRYYALSKLTDYSQRQMRDMVREQHGVELHSQGTISKLIQTYEKYFLKLGFNEEDLTGISYSSLYDLMKMLGPALNMETADLWVRRVRNMARTDWESLALDGRMPPPMTTWRLDENVAEIAEQAKAKLGEAAGMSRMSNTAFVEFVSHLLMHSDIDVLRALWRREHGDDGVD